MTDQVGLADGVRARLIADELARLAYAYHTTQEGEYGCNGVECPGVRRLIAFAQECVVAADLLGRPVLPASEQLAPHQLADHRVPNVSKHSLHGAFVCGAKWWEFEKTGGTMWASDRDKAWLEAERRYGPIPDPPAVLDEGKTRNAEAGALGEASSVGAHRSSSLSAASGPPVLPGATND